MSVTSRILMREHPRTGVVKTTKTLDKSKFDVPLYTATEAAVALGVPISTFQTWVKGYERHPRDQRSWKGDAIVTSFPSAAKQPSIPFIGLAEGMALAAIRQSGVPMQRIRPALVQLSKDIGIEHALASKSLYTDGAELLYDYSKGNSTSSLDEIQDLVRIRGQQRVFVPVVKDYLKRIEYSSDGYAKLIRLPGYREAEIVADPARAFGQPIFSHGAATVRDVLERFWAGDDIEAVSAEFGVPASEIEDVLRATSRSAA
jgi:uncharacterized protein (DUF433 family)